MTKRVIALLLILMVVAIGNVMMLYSQEQNRQRASAIQAQRMQFMAECKADFKTVFCDTLWRTAWRDQ
jgi:hypothetical protein